jgi:hypothetical protein
MLMCHLDVKGIDKGITCSCFLITLMPILGGSICVKLFITYQSGQFFRLLCERKFPSLLLNLIFAYSHI